MVKNRDKMAIDSRTDVTLCRKTPFQVLLLIAILTSLPPIITGADPVYTPQTLNDAAGNTADNTSSITWASWPTGKAYAASNPTRVSEGLVPYYNLVHSFIGSVFMKGFPNEIIEKGIDGDMNYIVENYSEFVTYFIGYAICVVIGILFLFIFPIVALCVCCCRCCCNNCGGKRRQLDKHAKSKCRRYSFAVISFVTTAFLAVSVCCIYINNENMTTTLTTAPDVASDNLNDIKVFANNTLEEATRVIVTNFKFVQDALFRDLDNIDNLVGLPLREQIKSNTNITATLNAAYALVDTIDYTDGNLSAVESALSSLETSLNTLTTNIDAVKTNLDAVFTTCGVNCTSAGKPSYNSTGTGVDSSQFPDLSSARTNMDNAKATNLTKQIQDASAELESIPERVKNDSLTTVNDLKGTITNLTDQLDDVMTQIRDFQGQVEGPNATIDLDSYSDQIESFSETIEVYDKYRWYGGIGLASIVLLVTLLALLGLVFGFLGSNIDTPPTERGCVSNCGGIMLMASAGLIMIFSAFLMLLTFPTFMIGAPLHQVVCKSLTDLDELEKMITIYNDQQVGAGKYFLGDLILGNDSIDLTVTGMLKSCRDGASAFTAFKLNDMFDIDDMLNYSKTLDVNAELDKVTVDFSSVTVYSADMKKQFADLKSAVNISFAEFYTELNNSPSSTNLSALADELDTYASGIPDPHKTDLQTEATELRRIEAEDLVYVQTNITALNTTVANMETSVSAIPAQIDVLDAGLLAADNYIQNNASDLVKTILSSYASRVLGTVDSYISYADDAVKTKMGKCEPIWNVYNSLLVHMFCYNFMDCFNGFWFSLGWAIFFFMFSMIFSIKLAKYYRTMLESDNGEVLDDGGPPPYDAENGKGYPPQVFSDDGSYYLNTKASKQDSKGYTAPANSRFPKRNNKVAHYDDCPPVTPAPPPDTTSDGIQVKTLPAGRLPSIGILVGQSQRGPPPASPESGTFDETRIPVTPEPTADAGHTDPTSEQGLKMYTDNDEVKDTQVMNGAAVTVAIMNETKPDVDESGNETFGEPFGAQNENDDKKNEMDADSMNDKADNDQTRTGQPSAPTHDELYYPEGHLGDDNNSFSPEGEGANIVDEPVDVKPTSPDQAEDEHQQQQTDLGSQSQMSPEDQPNDDHNQNDDATSWASKSSPKKSTAVEPTGEPEGKAETEGEASDLSLANANDGTELLATPEPENISRSSTEISRQDGGSDVMHTEASDAVKDSHSYNKTSDGKLGGSQILMEDMPTVVD